MKTILVPIDFSSHADYALEAASQLARRLDASIHLVHILEFPLPTTKLSALPSGYVAKAKADIGDRLQGLIDQKALTNLSATYEVRIGNPYRSITEALLEKKVDLVVMGSKGVSGLDEVLIGSNAERMVRFAPCPVLVIKEKTNLAEIRNIVYATALRNEEGMVLKSLSQLQRLYDAQLHLVKINTVNNFLADPGVKQRLEAFANIHHLKNYTVNTFSDIGEEEGIIHFAEEKQADLIALATHGRRGLLHLLEGSIAEDLVNHSKRPIWTMSLHPRTE